jgi:hypothetical protein
MADEEPESLNPPRLSALGIGFSDEARWALQDAQRRLAEAGCHIILVPQLEDPAAIVIAGDPKPDRRAPSDHLGPVSFHWYAQGKTLEELRGREIGADGAGRLRVGPLLARE